jgi:hypothetical protein
MRTVYNRKAIALLLAIAFIALILPISTVQSRSVDFRKLPFVEYATAQAVVLGPLPIFDVDISGSGYATHLGKITLRQHHTVDLTTTPPTFYDGTYTDTAANGGTIFGTYHGYMVPLQNGDLEIHGVFTIDGGTGRFSNVVGGGRAIGVQHPDGTAWLLLIGTISFK